MSNDYDLKSEIMNQELESAFTLTGPNRHKPIYTLDQTKYPNKWGFSVQFNTLNQCLVYILTEMKDEYFSKNIGYYLFSLLTLDNKYTLFSMGMNVKDRRWGLRVYNSCFVQLEALNWLVNNHFVKTIEDGETLGNKFIQSKYIKHVTGDFDFKRVFDEKTHTEKTLFFRFLTEKERNTLLKKEKEIESKLNDDTDTKEAKDGNDKNDNNHLSAETKDDKHKKVGKHERKIQKHTRLIDLLLTRVVIYGDLYNDIFICVGNIFQLPRNSTEKFVLIDNESIVYSKLEQCVRYILIRHLAPEAAKRLTISQTDSQAHCANEIYKLCIDSLTDIQKCILFAHGCNVRNRKYHGHEYKNVFIGKEAIDWLVANKFVSDRKTAVEFGNKLVDHGYFQHVKKEHRFKDKHYFYRFNNSLIIQNETFEIYSRYRKMCKKQNEAQLRLRKYQTMVQNMKTKANEKREMVEKVTQTLRKRVTLSQKKLQEQQKNGDNKDNTTEEDEETLNLLDKLASLPSMSETEMNELINHIADNEDELNKLDEMDAIDIEDYTTTEMTMRLNPNYATILSPKTSTAASISFETALTDAEQDSSVSSDPELYSQIGQPPMSPSHDTSATTTTTTTSTTTSSK